MEIPGKKEAKRLEKEHIVNTGKNTATSREEIGIRLYHPFSERTYTSSSLYLEGHLSSISAASKVSPAI